MCAKTYLYKVTYIKRRTYTCRNTHAFEQYVICKVCVGAQLVTNNIRESALLPYTYDICSAPTKAYKLLALTYGGVTT